MAYKGDPEKDLMVQFLDQKTMSFQTLIDSVDKLKHNCELNHIDPRNVPFVIETDGLKYAVPWFGIGLGIGKDTRVAVEFSKDKKCMPIVPDIRPEGEGEYWSSRGPGYPDISGFIKSKQAGERIDAMVDRVLGTKNHKTWLDYREFEPTWIQYKFHKDEFDMEKLDKLTKDNGYVITEEIIRRCKR